MILREIRKIFTVGYLGPTRSFLHFHYFLTQRMHVAPFMTLLDYRDAYRLGLMLLAQKISKFIESTL